MQSEAPNQSSVRIATTKDLKAVAKRLRKAFPTDTPVKVRMDIPAGHADFGSCNLIEEGERHFLIRIQKSLPYWTMVETMIHEWAHIVDWRPDFPFRCDHGPSWGVCYAEVYCEYYGVS